MTRHSEATVFRVRDLRAAKTKIADIAADVALSHCAVEAMLYQTRCDKDLCVKPENVDGMK